MFHVAVQYVTRWWQCSGRLILTISMTLSASSTLSMSKRPAGASSICLFSFSLASAIWGRKLCSRSRTDSQEKTHTHISLNITLMLFGRSTIDQLVTKKNARHSHRCFWGLSLSAAIFQLLDWGEASHWDLAAQQTNQLLLMTKSMLLYWGKRKTRFSWVG